MNVCNTGLLCVPETAIQADLSRESAIQEGDFPNG